MDQKAYQQILETEDHHWWFVGRRRILENLLRSHLTPKDKIVFLDIGCGTGGNFQLLDRFGHADGVEYDPEASQWAQKRCKGRVQNAGLPELNISLQNYDVVTLFDVLEHIDEDGASLKRIHQILKPNGQLILTVPAFQFLWSEHDVRLHHKRRYTLKQLTSLVEGAGFQIQRVTHFNFLLFHLIAPVRFLFRMLKIEDQSSDMDVPHPVLNSIFKFLFESEKWLLKFANLPYGVSIFLMAKKKSANF